MRVNPDGTMAMLLEDPTGEHVQGPSKCAFGRPHRRTLYIRNRHRSLLLKVEL
jgi:sugar lactone lactonase YvrE